MDLVLIQWGIVGLFVALHFLLGFLRGTSKSTYFTIVSIIMTFVTLWIVSLITIRWFFTPDTLLLLVNSYASGVLPAEFQAYFTDPQLSGFVFAMIDLVLRIIGFIILYPFLKTSVTFTFFRPIWKRAILPKLLERQNETSQDKYEQKFEDKKDKKRYKKSRRLKKTIISRFGGATAGAVRGFVVAFIVLLPIIVIGGFITAFDDSEEISSTNQPHTLSATTQINSLIPSEFQGYLEMIYDMHNNGLGGITQQITVNNKSFDRYLFDMVFTTQVVAGDTKTPINFGNELESITGIAAVVLRGGYIENGFDPMSIDASNLEDLEQIFGYIGRSDLINYVIPVATRFGVSNILTDMIGVDLYTRQASADALAEFEAISWEEEFMRLYDIVEAVLTFGSAQELMDYANNPALLAELSPEKGIELGNIIRAFSELRTLVLLNVAVDYATTMGDLQSQVTWVDELDREAYLAERFAFITSNVEFFIGKDSDWATIADMIEIVFSDEYGDIDLATIMGGTTDPAVFLNPDNAEWIGALLEKFVEIELIINAIPFGVDYGVYNALGDSVERELADRITEALNEVEWDQEILNIGDIYKEIAKLGIASIFGENPDYYALIDDIAINNMDAIRTIVSKIFDESAVINAAIELAVPIVLDTMIADTDLRDLAYDVMINDTEEGVIDFNFGQEINQILTIFEILYEFTSASEIASIGEMSTIAMLELFSSFGSISEPKFIEMTNAISNLQILERASKSGLEYAKNTLSLDVLYIPEVVNLADDINVILNLAYYVAHYINEKEAIYGLFEDVDFTELLLDEEFRAFLLSTPAHKHSELLFSNIAYNFKFGSDTLGLGDYLSIPQDLLDAEVESALWATEINNLLGAILDLAATVGASDGITLSIRGVTELQTDPLGLPITVVTQFADVAKATQAFGNLDASRVLRSSIIKTVESFGAQNIDALGGYALTLPESVIVDGLLKQGVLVELIHAIMLTLDDLNNTLGYTTLGQVTETLSLEPYAYLDAYNNLQNETLEVLTTSQIIFGIFSDIVLSPEIQALGRQTVNNLGLGFEVEETFLSIERPAGVLGEFELYELFLSVKAMQLSQDFIGNISVQIFDYFRTLDDQRLDQIFDVTLIKEILTFILTDENIIAYGAERAEGAALSAGDTVATIVGDNFDYIGTIRSIGEIQGPDGLIETAEIKNLIKAVNALDLNHPPLEGLGIQTITNALDRDINPDTGEDDFDRIFNARIIYVIISGALQNEGLGSFVTTTLESALGVTIDPPVDLLPPDSAIGVEGVHAAIEVDRITKAELRNIFTSIRVTGITTPADPSTLGIQLFLGMIDENNPDDDFMTFLGSDYLYVIIARIFSMPFLDEYLSEVLAGALGGDASNLAMTAPEDALGDTGVEDGLILRRELRQIFVSIKLISDDGAFSQESALNNLLGLIDLELAVGEQDDFHLFLESIFIWDKISVLLLADATVSLISAGRFETEDFILPETTTVTIGGKERMTREEVRNIFRGLKILGLDDFANVDLDIGVITDLSDDELDALLESDYLYTVIDLNIKAEDTLTLPSGAFEDGGVYDGMIKKTEIKDVFKTLEILAITDLTNIDPESITIAQIQQVLDETNSFVVQYLISQAIIEAIGADKIPVDAYLDGNVEQGILSQTELNELLAALTILSGGDTSKPLTEIDLDGITVGNVEDLKDNESFIIKQLVSDAIVDIIGLDNIPEEAFILGANSYVVTLGTSTLDAPTNRLNDDEIKAMIDAIVILANGDRDVLVTDISTDVTVGQTKQLALLPSLVIKQLVTDNIKDIIDPDGEGKIPVEAFVDNDPSKRLTDAEITAMVDAIDILAGGDDSLPIASLSTDVTVGQVKLFKTNNSLTIKQLLTDAIVDVIDPDDEGKIPLESYVDGDSSKRLTNDEINEMIDAIVILANNDDTVLVANISTDVTVGQLKELKTNNSLIIKQVLTDAIVDVIDPDDEGKIPLESYVDGDSSKRLTNDEINEMIDAIVILANDDDTVLVANISTDVTVGQLKAFKTNNSLIIKQLVSDSIVDTLSVDTNIPDEAHMDSDPTKRLTDDEINEMIDAIDILANGDDTLLVSAISTDVTVGQLKAFKTNNSIIIKQLVSDSIVDTLSVDNTIPNEAHMDSDPTKRLTDDEINEMIDAIDILANGDDTLLVSAISTDVTVGQLKAFKTNNSIIIKQLVSDSIVDTLSVNNTIPNEAHIDSDPTKRLTDDEINAMIDAIDILAGGDESLLVSNISTDITIGQLKALNASSSLIMAKLLSDSIVDAVGAANIPDAAYIDSDTNNNLTTDEIAAMIGVLEILASPIPPQTVDDVLVSAVSTNVTVGQTQELKTSESLIIKEIISNSIIDMIGAANIPNEAYIDNTPGNRLTDTEIENMIDAISILGDEDELVTDVNTDINIGQLKDLNASESLIIEKLISDQIITAVGLGSVPDDAYILDTPGNNLKKTEIAAMIGVLEILAGSEVEGDKDDVLVTSISVDVTVGQTQKLKTSDSVIIKQIITDSIVTMIGAANMPDEAFVDEDASKRLTDDEIEKMIDALAILGDDDDKVSDLDTDVTVGQVKQLDASESLIIKKLISDSIIEMLGTSRIPDEAYVDDTPGNNLKPSEVTKMISVLEILAEPVAPQVADDVVVTAIVINESNLKVATLKDFPDDSIILNRMISTALIDALGENKVPDESYVELVTKKDIKRVEIDAILEALEILGLETDGASSIGAADITFAQIDQVVAIGTDDAVKYPWGFSPIVVHILSTPMVSAVSDVRSGHDYGIPSTAYRNDNDLKHEEIVKLISSLKVIGNVGGDPGQEDPETTSIADVTINPTAFGPDLLEDLIAENSLIVYRLISIGINDAGIANDDAYAQVGDTNYDPELPLTPVIQDIKIAEMNHIVASMRILSITSIANVASEITLAKLQSLTPAQIEVLVEADTNGPNTIIYYIISETVDPSNNIFDTLVLLPDVDGPANDYYVMDPTRIRLKRSSIALAVEKL